MLSKNVSLFSAHSMFISMSKLTAFILFALTGNIYAGVSAKKDSIVVQPKTKSTLDKIIDYTAKDSIVFDIKKNKVYLYNEAELKYGDIELKSYYIEVDLNKRELFAKGGFDSAGRYTFLPVLKDGDDQYKADSMQYNSLSKKGRVYGLRLQQDEAYIHLSKVLKMEDGSFVGEKGKITTCNEDHPHFYFNCSKVKVVPNNKVFFGAANLVVEDVPTPLSVPFGLAPIKKGRRNGILFPSPGYFQANKSFFISNLGYYMGLGDNADFKILTDAYLNGDFRIGAGTNFMKRYKYRGTLNVNVSRFGNGAEYTSPQFTRNTDFNIIGSFAFDPKYIPGTVLNGNVNIQTGNFNRLNSRDINTLSRNQFTSGINFSRNLFNNKINFSSSARHFQNTQDRSFRLELPSISIGIPSITPFAGNGGNKWYQQLRLSYNLNFNNVLNTKDTILFSKRGKDEFKNMQNGISHSIPISTNVKMFKGILNFSPSVQYNEIWYFKSTIKKWDSASNKLVSYDTNQFNRLSKYSVSGSFSTNMYGTFQRGSNKKIKTIRHTITPTLGLNYSPEISESQRGWTRTYKDTSGEIIRYNIFEKGMFGSYNQVQTGSLGFGINNNLQAKKVVSVDSTGKENIEKINLIDAFNIGGSYNFLADSFQISDIRAGLNTVLLKQFNINIESLFSPYAWDEKNAKRIRTTQFETNKAPLRFRNLRASLNTRISPETFGKKKAKPATKKPASEEEMAELRDISAHRDDYYDFNIPWSLQFNYIFDYNKEAPISNRMQTNRIGISGDLRITPQWKIGYTSGYDFVRKEIASSQFSVTRDLHCWQLEFTWIPSGYGKMWIFSLRPKSGMLQDLKLNKRAITNPAFL